MSNPEPPPIDALLVNSAFVRRAARAVLGPDDRVEDVVQETWMVALQTGPDNPGALRSWLGKVARNRALRMRRRDTARNRWEHAAARPEAARPVDALIAQERMRHRLVEAVLALEEPYRTTMLLRYHQGISARRVAAMLGVPLETVRTRIKRGVARLRIRLEGGTDDQRKSARALLLTLASTKPLALMAGAGIGVGAIAMKKTAIVVGALLLFGALGVGIAMWEPRPVPPPETQPDPLEASTKDGPPPELATRTALPPPVAGKPPAPAVGSKQGLHFVVTLIDRETEEPVAGAVVTACHLHARRKGEASGTTDEDGAVRLFVLARETKHGAWPDAGCVLVESPGHARLVEHLHEHVRSKSMGDEVPIGPLRLLRGSSVSGQVLSADGRSTVTKPTLFLAAHQTMGSFGFAHPEMVASGVDDGHFELQHLRPCPVGNWFLYAVGEDSIGWTELPGSVGHTGLDDVEIRLQPTAAIVLDVAGPDGRAHAGAHVQLQPQFEPMRTDPRNRSEDIFMWFPRFDVVLALFRGRADAEGRHVFASVPVLAAGGARYRVAASSSADTKTADRLLPGCSAPFELLPGDRHEVTLTLQTVTALTVAGIVTNRKGTHLESARIVQPGTNKLLATTDAEGRFSIPDIERSNGRMYVRVEAEGYAPLTHLLEIPKSGPVPELLFELWRRKPITGRVVDQHGTPLEGIYVDLLRRGGDAPPQSSVHTDAQGRFRFENAVDLEFNLRVMPPAPYARWKRRTQGHTVVRGGQEDVVVRLERVPAGKAKVEVTIRDARSGAPIDASEVMFLRRPDGSGIYPPRATIERGRVTVQSVLPGTYALWARVSGHPASYAVLEVGETDTHVRGTIDVLDKEALATIRGRISFGDRERPERIFVSSLLTSVHSTPQWADKEGGGRVRHFMQVEADGTFRLDALVPGNVRVAMHGPTGWKAEETVVLTAGETTDLVLEAKRVGVLQLVVEKVPEGTQTVQYFVSKDGKDWTFTMNHGVRAGNQSDHTMSLEPGHWHWKVEFAADNIGGGNRSSAETQTGEVEVVVGQTVKIDVPVKPRAP